MPGASSSLEGRGERAGGSCVRARVCVCGGGCPYNQRLRAVRGKTPGHRHIARRCTRVRAGCCCSAGAGSSCWRSTTCRRTQPRTQRKTLSASSWRSASRCQRPAPRRCPRAAQKSPLSLPMVIAATIQHVSSQSYARRRAAASGAPWGAGWWPRCGRARGRSWRRPCCIRIWASRSEPPRTRRGCRRRESPPSRQRCSR